MNSLFEFLISEFKKVKNSSIRLAVIGYTLTTVIGTGLLMSIEGFKTDFQYGVWAAILNLITFLSFSPPMLYLFNPKIKFENPKERIAISVLGGVLFSMVSNLEILSMSRCFYYTSLCEFQLQTFKVVGYAGLAIFITMLFSFRSKTQRV